MTREFSRLTEGLARDPDPDERRAISKQLRNIGFAMRTSIKKRGSLSKSAKSRLAPEELRALHGALQDTDRSVRINAIIISGDLGDASSVPILEELCKSDDLNVRLAAIISLGDIGGPQSIAALTRLACDSSEVADIRFAALSELEKLAAKRITSGPDIFDPLPPQSTPDEPTHEPEKMAEQNAELLQKMKDIESDESADDLLRVKAADIRRYLESGIAD
ncbi:HEAT repeat domain-containing protein [Streptomyces lunaelactis]|nr:HEAT repeat domain-containing protein [Streptomyces lunaelactis]NUK25165.1 HEAT repeat domain-containing protein [Streptomyces lunaelactis]NUK85624.1 HEAT repeat domain-containing protein [Streptomyces lunaelactis]